MKYQYYITPSEALRGKFRVETVSKGGRARFIIMFTSNDDCSYPFNSKLYKSPRAAATCLYKISHKCPVNPVTIDKILDKIDLIPL